MKPVLWQYKNLTVEAVSLAGIRTAIALPQFSICFDVAQGLPHVLSMKKYFITHSHMDHAAGIPYVISQKNLQNIKNAEFYMPEEMVAPIQNIMNLWGELENHKYEYQMQGLKNNDSISINKSYSVKAFKSCHRVPSLGYTLIEHKKKIKDEYSHLTKNEILNLKKQNIVIERTEDIPIFTYTGDTTIDVFEKCEWILNSKVLFTEVTYLDERKSIEHARSWGHIHLDEIIPYLSKAKAEKIVFCHISSRYSLQEATQIIFNKIPSDLKHKVEVFAGR